MSPLRRRDTDPAAPARRREDVLEELVTRGSRNFRSYRRWALAAFTILAMATTAGLYWTSTLVGRIQDERAANILRACEEQNARHRETIETLDERIRIASRTASPARVRRMHESRAATVALIAALAPHQDCDEVVRRSVETD